MTMPAPRPLTMLFVGDRKSWEWPELTALNTVPAHALTIPFPSIPAALDVTSHSSPWVESLNGAWDFKLLPQPEAATEAALSGDDWAVIQVPGNWTMQGFGTPHYTNVIMPFPQSPPHVPADNPTGLYRRSFTVPASWQGRRVVLHIGGCEGVCYVYVNGQPIGLHKDAHTPAEYDVTAVLRFSEPNEVLAVVPRWSDASFVEDQDQWWQSGIHRDVFLYATDSDVFLADLCVRGDLSPNLRDGFLRVRCTLDSAGNPPARCRVEAQLYHRQAILSSPPPSRPRMSPRPMPGAYPASCAPRSHWRRPLLPLTSGPPRRPISIRWSSLSMVPLAPRVPPAWSASAASRSATANCSSMADP